MVLGMLVLPGALASIEPIDPLSVLTSYLPFFLFVLFQGPLGEEPGWRGFALPHLQRLNGPLVGTFILWPLWVFWHLPLFWSGHWIAPSILNVVMFSLVILPFIVIMTWVFNNTKGSVLIAILMHTSLDAFPNSSLLSGLFPVPIPILEDNGPLVYLPLVLGFWAVALVVIAVTRGRLGYQQYQRDDEPDLTTAPT
jgi:membrane protease YdiL (CAAX protease family)